MLYGLSLACEKVDHGISLVDPWGQADGVHHHQINGMPFRSCAKVRGVHALGELVPALGPQTLGGFVKGTGGLAHFEGCVLWGVDRISGVWRIQTDAENPAPFDSLGCAGRKPRKQSVRPRLHWYRLVFFETPRMDRVPMGPS